MNIVKFNYEFFLVALVVVIGLILAGALILPSYFLYFQGLAALVALTTVISLLVSWYVYDYSDLYTLSWATPCLISAPRSVLNIHAGFDEFSEGLSLFYPQAKLQVADFYDPQKHTERSIRRARRAYPSFPGTVQLNTQKLDFAPQSLDAIFLILAFHEIRSPQERVVFLGQLKDALATDGRLIVVEHARDLVNFLAYSIGFFHFLSPFKMEKEFAESGLKVVLRRRLTPFIRLYVLERS